MEPFRSSHPQYKSYESEHFHVTEVPREVLDGLHGLIVRHTESTDQLKSVVNAIRSCVPEPPTTNWGHDWIMGDLESAIGAIGQRSFHRFMDALGAVTDQLSRTQFPEDLEELLAEHQFGYRRERQGPACVWVLRDDDTHVGVAVIEDAQAEVGDVCDQALLHLEQAKENLKRGDERSRKDAVRDAMSAMESLYKSLSGTADIADAWKHLRDEKKWGPVEIVKDGYVVWSTIHLLYPDIRHGQASPSVLSDEEAHYWIGRISNFVKYMARRHE